MLAFGETLTAEQVGDLVHLIRTRSRPVTPAVTTSAGGTEAWATDRDIPVVIHPEGQAPSFSPANGYISAAEVNTALTEGRRMVLLDARAVSDWRAMHLPGGLPAPFYDDTEAGASAAGRHAGRGVLRMRSRRGGPCGEPAARDGLWARGSD
jgi:cytochrome c oxidase cbb3-type subunit 3